MKIDIFYVDCATILHQYDYAKVLRRVKDGDVVYLFFSIAYHQKGNNVA